MKISQDLHNNVKQVLAVSPIALGATGAVAGRIIDRQGYAGVEFVTQYGAITTTGTIVTAVMKEGDATGSRTSVADADMIGTEALAGLAASTDRTSGSGKIVAKRVGYKGTKRYVSLDLNHTGTTSVGAISAVAVLFNPEAAPVSNP